MHNSDTYLAWMVADTMDCLYVVCWGTSIVTSNLGKTYSATKNDLWNTWSSTLTTMFQSPSTGDSDNCSSDEKTPRVVSALLQCFTRFPLPSLTDKRYRRLLIVRSDPENGVATYRDENVQSSRNGRFQMVIQHDCSKLHNMSRFVDGFVGLDKHRITLVNVFEYRGVEKL